MDLYTHPNQGEKESVRDALDPQDPKTQPPTSVYQLNYLLHHMERAEDRGFAGKLLRSVDGQERRQLVRLRAWAPADILKILLRVFDQWKTFVRAAGPGLVWPELYIPIQAEKVIKWIQNAQTVEDLMATIKRPRLRSEQLIQDNNLVMLALQHAVDKTHLVLEYILRDHAPRPSYAFYLFEDTLEMLAARLQREDDLDKPATAMQLANLVSLVLTETDKRFHFRPYQSTIHKLLHFLPPEELPAWYEQLRDTSCHLTPYTELQFASRFAKSPSTKVLSLDILRRIKEGDLIAADDPVLLSVSTSILKFTEEDLRNDDSGLPTPADIFAALSDIGLSPNLFTYSVILYSLCIRRDLDTAMEVFGLMKHQGFTPDTFAYEILAHGCVRTEAYGTLVDLAVEACRANVKTRLFWNNVIFAIHNYCIKKRSPRGVRRSSIYPVNAMLTRVFDVARLRPFITEVGHNFAGAGSGVPFPDHFGRLQLEVPPLPPQELLTPNLSTLAIFLLAMIRSLPEPHDVVVFYAHFKNLLQQRHPDAERLVQRFGTYIYDAILRSLVCWKGTRRVVFDIVRDMMANADDAGTAASDHTDSGAPGIVQPPAPSVYTWAILIKSFMTNRQPEKAEQCIDLMRHHGIEPDLVTWNTLTVGYANMQNIRGVVSSMQRLEAAGLQADDWTMRAFKRLHNKRKAIELMEKRVEDNRREMEKEEPGEHLHEDANNTNPDVNLEEHGQPYEQDPSIFPQSDFYRQMVEQVDHVEEQGEEEDDSPLEDVDVALSQLDLFEKNVALGRLQEVASADRLAERYEAWQRSWGEDTTSVPPPKSLEEVKRAEGAQQEQEQQSSQA